MASSLVREVAATEVSSQQTLRWRKMDSNHRSATGYAGLFRERMRCQRSSGLEPFFDRSETESSDLDPAAQSVHPANFSRVPAARIGPALSSQFRLSSPAERS